MDRFVPQALQNRQLVAKATSDDDTPTPGYLFNELSKLTHDGNTCRELEDLLLGRLEKKSTNVKLKTLRMVKSVCERGHPNFKRDMQRRTNLIRDCLHFRGEAHPTLGDVPNKLVRESAQEAMTAIFDTESKTVISAEPASTVPLSSGNVQSQSSSSYSSYSNTSMGSDTASVSNNISRGFNAKGGFGSDDYARDGAGGGSRDLQSYSSSASGKYGGYGNTEYPQQDNNQKKLDAAKDVATKGIVSLVENATALANKLQEKVGTPMAKAAGVALTGGNSGTGGLYSNHGFVSSSSASSSSAYPPTSTSTYTADSAFSVAAPTATAKISAPGDYESKLVDKITAVGGIRAVPPREELKQFCSQCESLHLQTVLELLNSKLSDPQWQCRLKALHVFDALLRSAVKSEAKAFLSANPDAVRANENSPQASVKEMAVKVSRIMDGAVPSPSLSSSTATRGSDQTGSLLDFDDNDNSQQDLPTLPQSTAPVSSGLSMFAGLSLAPSSSPSTTSTITQPTATTTAASLLGDFDAPPPNTIPPAVATTGFSFIDGPTASNGGNTSADLLGDTAPSLTAAATTTTTTTTNNVDVNDGMTELERELLGKPGQTAVRADSFAELSGNGMTPQQMMMQQQLLMQQQMMMQQMMMQQQRGGGGVRPMIPPMINQQQQPTSGFNFMQSQPDNKDAFDFVGDAIKASKKPGQK